MDGRGQRRIDKRTLLSVRGDVNTQCQFALSSHSEPPAAGALFRTQLRADDAVNIMKYYRGTQWNCALGARRQRGPITIRAGLRGQRVISLGQ